MTATASAPASLLPPVPGDGTITAEGLVARAESVAAHLVALQQETELRTFYGDDVHETFRREGFYRILVPRRFAGLELGAETFMRVAMALARGCPSTGWMYVFGSAHALAVATLFDEQAQSELFAGGEFICPATVSPGGSAEPAPDGGWFVEGTWNYCSGSPYATHFMGHTMAVPPGEEHPRPLLFVVPRSSWRRLDDWSGQLGLRGSGSHGITVPRTHVPARHTIAGHLSQVRVGEGTPGRHLHANPEYAGGPLSFMLLELGALAVGMAKGALDTYEELMRTRTTTFFPIVSRTQDPDHQLRYGEAAGMVAAAEAAFLGAVREWHALCHLGPDAFTREAELRLALISREAVRLSWRAVETQLVPAAGSSAVREGERLGRIWRDMSMLHSHAGVGVFLSTLANRELAKAHFGVS